MLRSKHPDKNAKIRIVQEGLKVILIIETSAGDKEAIELTLTEYGDVLLGRLPITNFIEDPLQILALQHKLEIAQLELRQAQLMIEYERSSTGTSINRMEQEIGWLRHHIGDVLQHSEVMSQSLMGKDMVIEGGLEAILQSIRLIAEANHDLRKDFDLLVETLRKTNPTEADITALEQILRSIETCEPKLYERFINSLYDFSIGFTGSIWASIFLKIIENISK